MFGAVFTVFSAALTFSVANAEVTPAGICNNANIKAVSLNYSSNANLHYWDVLYVTNCDPFSDMDHFLVAMTANGDDTYREDDTIMYKNSTESKQTYKQTYVENVISQDATDSTGEGCHFDLIPMEITSDNAVLYLRCTNGSGLACDTRFIAVPNGTHISDSSLKQLMDKDASYNFTGSLVELPNNTNKNS